MDVVRAVRTDSYLQYDGTNATQILDFINANATGNVPLFTYVSEANDVLTVNVSSNAAYVYAWSEGDTLIPELYYVNQSGNTFSPGDFNEQYIVKS